MLLRIISWNVKKRTSAVNAAVDLLINGIGDVRQAGVFRPKQWTTPAIANIVILLEPAELNMSLDCRMIDEDRVYSLISDNVPKGPGLVAGYAELGGFNNEQERAYIVYDPEGIAQVRPASDFNAAQAKNRQLSQLNCRLPVNVYVDTPNFKIRLSGLHAPWPQSDSAQLTTFLTGFGNLVQNTPFEANTIAHFVMGDFNTIRKNGQWGNLMRITGDVISTSLNENCQLINPYDAAWAFPLRVLPKGTQGVNPYSGRVINPGSQMQPSDMAKYTGTDFCTKYSDHVPIYLELESP